MLSQFEWYRRWRGGTFFLHVNNMDWYRITESGSQGRQAWRARINAKEYRGRYYTYPGRGAKPRMRLYAKVSRDD